MDLPWLDQALKWGLVVADNMRLAFLGGDWRALTFQCYTVFVLAVWSMYKIIGVRGTSVVVLSHAGLAASAVVAACAYFGVHRLILAIVPANRDALAMGGFVVASLLIVVYVPMIAGGVANRVICRFTDGDYLIDNRSSESRDSWRCDTGFARKVSGFYYAQGLYLPVLYLTLTSGSALVACMFAWALVFGIVLIRLHGTDLFAYGYLIILLVAMGVARV